TLAPPHPALSSEAAHQGLLRPAQALPEAVAALAASLGQLHIRSTPPGTSTPPGSKKVNVYGCQRNT
ncbi:MAG: hypothetical protein ACK56I_33810, partial [bacterium]